jgi:hypothetical protein
MLVKLNDWTVVSIASLCRLDREAVLVLGREWDLSSIEGKTDDAPGRNAIKAGKLRAFEQIQRSD